MTLKFRTLVLRIGVGVTYGSLLNRSMGFPGALGSAGRQDLELELIAL